MKDSIRNDSMGTKTVIEIMGQLSDMKDTDYRNTLAIASLIELLINKGIITREELANKAEKLDQMAINEVDAQSI